MVLLFDPLLALSSCGQTEKEKKKKEKKKKPPSILGNGKVVFRHLIHGTLFSLMAVIVAMMTVEGWRVRWREMGVANLTG